MRRLDSAFDVARLFVLAVAGQRTRRDVERMEREEGDAIEALLAHDRHLVAGGLDFERGKLRFLRLDFLQDDHVRLGALEPGDQIPGPLADGVYVPGGDLHSRADLADWPEDPRIVFTSPFKWGGAHVVVGGGGICREGRI